MPPKPDAPLRKVSLNLYAADCEAMASRYGYGWSERVRQLVHEHLQRKQTAEDYLNKLGYGEEPYRG